MSHPQNTKQTVLVCEDNLETQKLLEHILSGMNLNVLLSSNGKEAQQVLKNQLPDIILLDLMMPEMSGEEFLAWLRAEVAEFIPVLIITAKDELQDLLTGFDLGADDFLTKPYELSEFRVRVQALLRTKRLTKQLQELRQELINKERQLAVAQLAGAAAHNLRQPLTALLLECEVLRQIPSVDMESSISRIEAECHKMEQTLERISNADSSQTIEYIQGIEIIDINKSK